MNEITKKSEEGKEPSFADHLRKQWHVKEEKSEEGFFCWRIKSGMPHCSIEGLEQCAECKEKSEEAGGMLGAYQRERKRAKKPKEEKSEEERIREINAVYEEFIRSWPHANLDSSIVFRWLMDNGYSIKKVPQNGIG